MLETAPAGQPALVELGHALLFTQDADDRNEAEFDFRRVDRLNAEDSPAIVQFQGLITEIPVGGLSGRGRVIQSYVSRPKPGQLEAAIDLTRQAFSFLEKHGAVGTRLFQQTVAGSQSDTLVASWEFESMQALGKAGDAFMTDPAGIALAQSVAQANSPVAVVNSSIYRDVPLS